MGQEGVTARIRYKAGDVWHAVQDAALFWGTRLRGGTYADFYAAKMDRKARKIGVGVNGRPEDKAFHLAFLKANGLQRSMDFLDYGCGAAAAGVHFIEFLDPGRYTGADVSAECLALARGRLDPAGLSDRRAEFLYLPGGSLSPLAGRQYDIVWAQSVLTHLPADWVAIVFKAVAEMMRRDAACFATFTYSDRPGRQSRVKNFDYHADELLEIANRVGLAGSVVDSWVHPASPADRMLRLVHAPTRAGQ